MNTEEKKEIVKSEVEDFAKFNLIRYAQVWEDADILREGLQINSNDNILSIASAGENSLALLIDNPKKVYAIDLNFNQIACTEFKKMAYKYLDYEEAMKLIGVFDCDTRVELYKKIKDQLSDEVKDYFNKNSQLIQDGIIHTGKFENYFHIFANKVLPLIHSKKICYELLQRKSKEERYTFYEKKWNNLRWKMAFRIFFSRTVMGKLGRDKAFFRYVNVNVAEHILERTKYAVTELDTSENSYLYYIIKGRYDEVLPAAYRKENFEKIKANIDNLVLLSESVETFIERDDIDYISKYNLSDIFEYMDDSQMCKIYEKMKNKSGSGTRIAYWNMLADKRISKYYDDLEYKEDESNKLLNKDKAFFYSKFIIEEIN